MGPYIFRVGLAPVPRSKAELNRSSFLISSCVRPGTDVAAHGRNPQAYDSVRIFHIFSSYIVLTEAARAVIYAATDDETATLRDGHLVKLGCLILAEYWRNARVVKGDGL